MAVVELITPTWDRGPDQKRAQHLALLYRRRDRVLNDARHLFSARSPRRRDLVIARLERVAGLHRDYVQLGARILDIELL